jgi:hypothetical protein
MSNDQTFCPVDPAFLYPDPQRRLKELKVFDISGYTYTFIHPREEVEDVILPFDLLYQQGAAIDGQSFSALGPRQSMETVVLSHEGAKERVTGPMIWRVKLRKEAVANGRGVATVIGVPFSPTDVITVAEHVGFER